MVRTSLLITFLRYQKKLPSRVFLRPDRIEFHRTPKTRRKGKKRTSLATTRARSVDRPSLGGNSFERRSESERMENGAASGGIERDALFNREMRTCWSVREGGARRSEELWKHRAVTIRGKVVRLPCRSRRGSSARRSAPFSASRRKLRFDIYLRKRERDEVWNHSDSV